MWVAVSQVENFSGSSGGHGGKRAAAMNLLQPA